MANKDIEVILHASDGYNGNDWEWTLKVTQEDYDTIFELARQYEFDNEVDYSFSYEYYEVDEYEAFTDHIEEAAPEVFARVLKEAEEVIAESFDEVEEMDPDEYETGFYFNLGWLMGQLTN